MTDRVVEFVVVLRQIRAAGYSVAEKVIAHEMSFRTCVLEQNQAQEGGNIAVQRL